MLNMEKKSIIYIDDDELNLELFEMNFKKYYNVIICEDPRKALDIIKKSEIKVIITDYKMPIMNGLSLINNIKEFKPNVACLVLSGYLESDVLTDKIKVFRYMMKPYQKSEMINAIEEAFNSVDSSIPED
jgi:two-component system response regulator (stage 0 sporulation protein F)